MTRYAVLYDPAGNPEDPSKKWAVIDLRAARLAVKFCDNQDQAELTADLYEREQPLTGAAISPTISGHGGAAGNVHR